MILHYDGVSVRFVIHWTIESTCQWIFRVILQNEIYITLYTLHFIRIVPVEMQGSWVPHQGRQKCVVNCTAVEDLEAKRAFGYTSRLASHNVRIIFYKAVNILDGNYHSWLKYSDKTSMNSYAYIFFDRPDCSFAVSLDDTAGRRLIPSGKSILSYSF